MLDRLPAVLAAFLLVLASSPSWAQRTEVAFTWGDGDRATTILIQRSVISIQAESGDLSWPSDWTVVDVGDERSPYLLRHDQASDPKDVWNEAVADFGPRRTLGLRCRVAGTQVVRDLTPEFILVLPQGIDPRSLADLHRQQGVEVLHEQQAFRRLPWRYVRCRPSDPSATPQDALELYDRYLADRRVLSVWPNLVETRIVESSLPTAVSPQAPSPGWHRHHDEDADIDLKEAWALHRGEDIVVAAWSSGTLEAHEALRDHFVWWVGFAFSSDQNPCLCVGDCCSPATHHGTAVSGILAGEEGASPKSKLVSAKRGTTAYQLVTGLALLYVFNVRVITVSQAMNIAGPNEPLGDLLDLVTQQSVICFAATNLPDLNLDTTDQASRREDVLAVGGSDVDHSVVAEYAYGTCIDLVAPSKSIYAPKGETGGATDLYTSTFEGSSAAAPLVGGVAALVLSADPSLSPVQVIRLLRDTADKIDPNVQAYDPKNGRCGSATPRAGYGRVNALEAVTVASITRNQGVDLFIRDHPLDWGNTERPSNMTHAPPSSPKTYAQLDSPDISIVPPDFDGTGRGFASLDPDVGTMTAGSEARVGVLVRNRGPYDSTNTEMQLFWNDGGGWKSTGWKAIGTVPYSGASVAGTGDDAAVVATFDLDIALNTAAPVEVIAAVRSAKDPIVGASAPGSLSGSVFQINNVARRTFPVTP